MKYLLEIQYPHSWNSGYTLHFDTLEEARTRAEEIAASSSSKYTEHYIEVTIWAFEERVN